MKVENEKSLRLDILEKMRNSSIDEKFLKNFEELNNSFICARLECNTALLKEEPLGELLNKWEHGEIKTLTDFLINLKKFSDELSYKNRESLCEKLFGNKRILNKINFHYLNSNDCDFLKKPLIRLKNDVIDSVSFAMERGLVDRLFYNVLGLSRADDDVKSAEQFLKNSLESTDYPGLIELKNDLLKLFFLDKQTLKDVEILMRTNYDFKESKIVFSRTSDFRSTISKTNQLKLNPICLDYDFLEKARALSVEELKKIIYRKLQTLLLETYRIYLMNEKDFQGKSRGLYSLTQDIQLYNEEDIDEIVLKEFKDLKDFDYSQRKIILESIKRILEEKSEG